MLGRRKDAADPRVVNRVGILAFNGVFADGLNELQSMVFGKTLARMLTHVGRGRILAPAATGHFRRFALWLMLAATAQVVLPVIATLVLASATRQGAAALAVNADDLLGLFLTAVFYFVANLFDEAARLDEDSRSTI